jgi:hypothetical protein
MFSVVSLLSQLRDDLRDNPIALVLVIINALFAGVVVYTLQQISSATARRDALVAQLIEKCK